MYKHRSL